jgi:FMN phosphatase YigB (HAD superfamily)
MKNKPSTISSAVVRGKIVLFDIDHTIFNANLYRRNLYTNLAKGLGYDIQEFIKSAEKNYEKMRKTTYYFTPDMLLKAILHPFGKPEHFIKAETIFWEKLLYEACIYPEVKKVFSFLSENNYIIGIFSTGDLEHQKIKIESLKEYLDENHIYISPDKFKIIKDAFRVYKKHQVYLIDDYPLILEEAKKHHKNIFTIFINRKSGYDKLIIPKNFKPDATISNLSQLIDIIRTDK